MSTRRMGLISIPQEEWLLYPKLVVQDEEIPQCVKHTFMSLHARANENRALTLVSKQAEKMLSGKSGRTFRDHLNKLRKFGLIGTSKTGKGDYIEFYSPWLRYTRIRQKREQYSVEPNSWIHPRIAQYMHIAGKFPSDLKKLCKEYQDNVTAVEKAMESLAWDVIHRDLAENGYAYVPDKKHPGVYTLVMYKGKNKRLVHDTSMFPENHNKTVWASNVITGKRTKITFERSVIEAVTVDPDLKEAVETRDSFDQQAYALGYRMGQNAYMKRLQTYAAGVAVASTDRNGNIDMEKAIQMITESLANEKTPDLDPEDPDTKNTNKRTYEESSENSGANGMDANSVQTGMITGNDALGCSENCLSSMVGSSDSKQRVISEKLPMILVNNNSSNTIINLISSLYLFHKEINNGGIRYASLRSCYPYGGNCKLQNAEATEGATEGTFVEAFVEAFEGTPILHDIHIPYDDNHNKVMINTNNTETEETDTETEQNVTTLLHDHHTGNTSFTETEQNFTETDSGTTGFAFSVNTPSNTDKTVGDLRASEPVTPGNTDKVVSDSEKPSDILSRIHSRMRGAQEKQDQDKIQQKQKRADRKARKALRDVLASTDIKIPNLTCTAGADRLIADVCSHGLALDPDRVIPAWSVKHPAVRWEEYQAEQNRVIEADKDLSWISNIAMARKKASLTLTEPLESLSWRSTLSSTYTDHERSLNALKRFKAKLNHKIVVDPKTKKHYPACYRDQK